MQLLQTLLLVHGEFGFLKGVHSEKPVEWHCTPRLYNDAQIYRADYPSLPALQTGCLNGKSAD